MNRQEKEHIIETLKSSFAANQTSFLINYKGMDVAEVTTLRKELRNKGGSFKVAKVTLIRRAMHDLPAIEGFLPLIKDQVGIVFAEKEATAVAKVLNEFSKQNPKLHILAGRMEDTILTKDSVAVLASLPSKEILLAKVCGSLNAPIAGFVGTLNALLVKLVLVLRAVEESKKSAS
jgi:large subunit ribosomal protein L10